MIISEVDIHDDYDDCDNDYDHGGGLFDNMMVCRLRKSSARQSSVRHALSSWRRTAKMSPGESNKSSTSGSSKSASSFSSSCVSLHPMLTSLYCAGLPVKSLRRWSAWRTQ